MEPLGTPNEKVENVALVLGVGPLGTPQGAGRISMGVSTGVGDHSGTPQDAEWFLTGFGIFLGHLDLEPLH